MNKARDDCTVLFTDAELEAALEALGQMTDGNNNDFREWQGQTSGTAAQWRALLRAERKMYAELSRRRMEESAAA